MSAAPEGGAGRGGDALAQGLAQATSVSPHATTVMSVAAYLAPRQIPIRLLAALPFGEAGARGAADALVAAGLARHDPLAGGAPALSVEVATQERMRQQLGATAGAEERQVALALQALAAIYPPGAEAAEAGRWHTCEELDRHLRAALAFAPDAGAGADLTSDLLHRLAHYLFARGRYEEAEQIVRRSGAVDEELMGPDHPHVGQDCANLAILLHELGRTDEALPLIRRAMAIGEEELGPEHPLVAERYHILASLLEAKGRLAEADPFIRHALVTSERMLGARHDDTRLYRQTYERILAAMDRVARKDDAVEAGLVPAPPERLARPDLPPPPPPSRGVLGRLLRGRGA
jgi:tetratricopeptide (TPR) repeat protein